MGFSQIVFAYFAPDGTVLTQFNNWWNIPGVNYDTFVCRNASTKSVSRSCNGANCKPDIIPGILQAVDMTDSCSVTGNEGSLTITLTKKVHQYSKDKIFKNRSLDTNLRVQLSIRGMKDPSGAYKCDADIHASMQANPLPKLPPDIVAQDYEYAGADKTPKFTGSCNIYQGKNLYDWGKMSGKVIDAGP